MRATHAIPCKRPKVPVVDNKGTAAAYCLVGIDGPSPCDWKYGPGVKTDVEQQATWHRHAHRAAVPRAEVGGPTVSLNYFAICECGWRSGAGVITRTDNEQSLARHLSTVHGLVSC